MQNDYNVVTTCDISDVSSRKATRGVKTSLRKFHEPLKPEALQQ